MKFYNFSCHCFSMTMVNTGGSSKKTILKSWKRWKEFVFFYLTAHFKQSCWHLILPVMMMDSFSRHVVTWEIHRWTETLVFTVLPSSQSQQSFEVNKGNVFGFSSACVCHAYWHKNKLISSWDHCVTLACVCATWGDPAGHYSKRLAVFAWSTFPRGITSSTNQRRGVWPSQPIEDRQCFPTRDEIKKHTGF